MVKLRYKLDRERFSGSVKVWCAYKGREEATAGSMRAQSWNLLSKISIQNKYFTCQSKASFDSP